MVSQGKLENARSKWSSEWRHVLWMGDFPARLLWFLEGIYCNGNTILEWITADGVDSMSAEGKYSSWAQRAWLQLWFSCYGKIQHDHGNGKSLCLDEFSTKHVIYCGFPTGGYTIIQLHHYFHHYQQIFPCSPPIKSHYIPNWFHSITVMTH